MSQELLAVVCSGVSKRSPDTGDIALTSTTVGELLQSPENFRKSDILRAALFLIDQDPSVELEAGMVEDLRLLALKIAGADSQ